MSRWYNYRAFEVARPNVVLPQGVLSVDPQTGKLKVGDNHTRWRDLPELGGGDSGASGAGPALWIGGIDRQRLPLFTRPNPDTFGVTGLKYMSEAGDISVFFDIPTGGDEVTFSYSELTVTSIDGLNSLTVETDAPVTSQAWGGATFSTYGTRGAGLAVNSPGDTLGGISVSDAGIYVVSFLGKL